MYTKFFVALNFFDSASARKIQGFRQRFDPKFNQHVEPHMSMLAPFEIRTKDKAELIELLKDEIENFFLGGDDTPKLKFKGLDVYKQKRVNILYLNPDFSDDLKYCMESVQQLCKSLIPPEINYRPNAKQFLPLAHCAQEEQLLKLMPLALEEFNSNSDLYLSGISLYEKRFGIWSSCEEIIQFENPNESFLQLQHVSI